MKKVTVLRAYEGERLKEIVANSKELGEPPTFIINKRMVRSWPELRKKWLAHASADEATLLSDISTEQSKKRGKFGDPHLYRWLAKPGNHLIWNKPSEDAVRMARMAVYPQFLDTKLVHCLTPVSEYLPKNIINPRLPSIYSTPWLPAHTPSSLYKILKSSINVAIELFMHHSRC